MATVPIVCELYEFIAPSPEYREIECEYTCDSSSSSSESSEETPSPE